MRTRATLSVVITAHNAADTLPSTLAALVSQVGLDAQATEALEIVIVDDRSTDGTADAVAALGMANVRVVPATAWRPGRERLTSRQAALDTGVRATHGDRILLLDADALPPEDWARSFADVLESAEVVGGRVAFVPHRGTLLARLIAALQTADAAFYLAVCDALSHAGFASGMLFGSAAFTRALYDRVGGFAALGFTLTEDLYFARAAHRLGARMRFADSAPVVVRGARNWGEVVRRALRVSATGGLSALSATIAGWVLLLPALAALAATLGGVWSVLFAARYGAGVLVIIVALARSQRLRLWPLALVYEMTAVSLGVVVAVAALSTSDVQWGGVRYARRSTAVPRTPH